MPWNGPVLGKDFPVNFFFALLLVAVSLPGAALTPDFKIEQHKATMTIVMLSKDEKKGAGCSATAIAPHVILTAEHCNVKDGKLYLNQNEKPLENGLKVVEKYFDHNDHMLMVVPGVEFKHYVPYDAAKIRSAQQGEHVYLWGNPALMMDQYREGYASGVMHFSNAEMGNEVNASGNFTMLAVPIVGGDSGSAVFSALDGQIVGITTWGIFNGKFLGSYPLQFTQEQINQAEGRGNFVYIPQIEPETNIKVVAPSTVVFDASPLTRLFAVFVVLFALPTLYRGAEIGARYGRRGYRSIKDYAVRLYKFHKRTKCRSTKCCTNSRPAR
jgi:hypothetical protein